MAIRMSAILFCALALIPGGAHLIELPNKLHLSADHYRAVQVIYRGWSLAGIVVVGALLSTVALTLALRHRRGFTAALIGLLCIVATQIIFWSVTFPVNQTTNNWTLLPANWQALRLRWEFSHATNAILNAVALFATTIASVRTPARV